jgi:hypothetical protein
LQRTHLSLGCRSALLFASQQNERLIRVGLTGDDETADLERAAQGGAVRNVHAGQFERLVRAAA